jgi:DNA mismatch endonuclease (patch repair protein)
MAIRTKTALMPRFAGLAARSKATSRVGAANRKKNTAPEILLRKALAANGLRFVVHATDLPGCPDLVIRRYRIAVFCDGDFWHGRRWSVRKKKLAIGWNGEYWVAKIERNRRRDRIVTRALRKLGWRVVRVWEGDVRRNPERAVAKILRVRRATTNLG